MRKSVLAFVIVLWLSPCLGAEFPWAEVDQLFKLELDTRLLNVPTTAALIEAKCTPEQVARGWEYESLQPAQLTRSALADVLSTKESRAAILSAKEPHQIYLLARVLMLNLLRNEALQKGLSGKDMLAKAVALGDQEASVWSTGYYFWNAHIENTDWKTGWTVLNEGAKKGIGQAYYLLATYYAVKNFAYSKYTRSFVPDEDKTRIRHEWLCKAAELGYPQAMLECGSDFRDRKDLVQAEKWLARAAEIGLGTFYLPDKWFCVVPKLADLCPVCPSLRKYGKNAPVAIPEKFTGIYALKQSGEAPQYLILKAKGPLVFLGTDDFGEDRRAYFGMAPDDLRLSDTGEIEFRVGPRTYFGKPFTPKETLPRKGKDMGRAFQEKFFKGQIKDGRVSLTCEGDCSRKMEFAK